MKLAFIPPVQLLRYTELTNMQLMLPHMLRNGDYAKHYKQLCELPDQYVIMDNGAAESERFDNEALRLIANEYKVDELVLPDVIGDWPATVGLGMKFLDECDDWNLNLDIRFGVVAQGRTVKEAFECVSELIEYRLGEIEVIHIPRLLITQDAPMARLQLAEKLHQHYGDGYDYHLLGASRLFPLEIFTAAHRHYIRSMDTSMPFVFGRNQVRVNKEGIYPPPHRAKDDDYFLRIWSATEELYSQYNMNDMLAWSRG